jgi:hypothetical protein
VKQKKISDYLMLFIPSLVLGTIVGGVIAAVAHGFWPALFFLLPGSLWLLALVDAWERWSE